MMSGAEMQHVRLFRPLQGATALQTLANVSSMTVDVPDHPGVLRLVPTPSASELVVKAAPRRPFKESANVADSNAKPILLVSE